MLRGGVLASSSWQARSRAVLVKAGGADGNGGGRQPWDVVRFVRTVLFFNEPPRPERVLKDLQQAVAKAASGLGLVAPGQQDPATPVVPLDLPLAQGEAHSDPPLEVPVDGIIMVTGATGGVGKRVVQKLLAAGKHVRALVRDVDKAVPLLSTLPVAAGGRLELACADVTQRQTLLPEMFAGVRAVVCCTAVKVQPKEGDTANRAKYYQGIKFYDPEIAGDTPEAVELVGLRNLLEAAKEQLGTEAGEPLLLADGSGQAWGALDDVVMGGVSSSSMAPREGAGEGGGPAMVFSGTVSTDNFGGFASVRTRNFEPALDLGAYSGLELRLLGDGQRYKFIIRTESAWDGIGYTTSFDTQPGVWQTVRLPFDSFVPVFRARSLRDAPHMNPSSVSSIQLMLSKFEYDGQLNPKFRPGPFALPIEHITTYLPENASPRFVHVSSAGVTRPNRPGINVEVEPPAVRMNDMLGGILTYKLAGEDALRASGVPYAIVRPTALTEEPAGMPLEFDQGDVIKGKIGREDVAELCIALLSQPAATNTTFEVKSTVPFSQPWTVDPSNPPPRRDWSATLAAANLRRGVTGRTVQGVYTGRLPEEEVLKVAMATAPATAGAAS